METDAVVRLGAGVAVIDSVVHASVLHDHGGNNFVFTKARIYSIVFYFGNALQCGAHNA